MHDRRFLPDSWQRIFNNLSKDASLSMHDILLCNVIIGSVRTVAETLDVTSTFYSTMQPNAKKAFDELYYIWCIWCGTTVSAALTSPRKHFTRQGESLSGPRII